MTPSWRVTTNLHTVTALHTTEVVTLWGVPCRGVGGFTLTLLRLVNVPQGGGNHTQLPRSAA